MAIEVAHGQIIFFYLMRSVTTNVTSNRQKRREQILGEKHLKQGSAPEGEYVPFENKKEDKNICLPNFC